MASRICKKKMNYTNPGRFGQFQSPPSYGWNFRDNQKTHKWFPQRGPRATSTPSWSPRRYCLSAHRLWTTRRCPRHPSFHISSGPLVPHRLGWKTRRCQKNLKSGHERNMFFHSKPHIPTSFTPHLAMEKQTNSTHIQGKVAQSPQSSEFLTALKVNVDGIPSDIYKTKTFVVIKVPDHASHLHPIHHLHTSFQQAHIPGSQKFKSLKWLEYTLRHHAASKNAKLCKSLQNQTPTPANHKVPLPKQKQRCAWHSLSQVRVCPPVPAAIRPRFHPTCGVAVGQATSTDHPRCREISATHPSPQTWTWNF